MLMNHVQGARLDAERHGQLTPEFAVELHGHFSAFGPCVDLPGHEGLHRAIQRPPRHDPGEDIGPEEGAHALDQDGLELAARQQAWPRHPVVPAVEVAVGDYGKPRDFDLVAVADLQWREPVPEEHPERGYRERQAPQEALQTRRDGIHHLRIEAYAGHAREAALGAL